MRSAKEYNSLKKSFGRTYCLFFFLLMGLTVQISSLSATTKAGTSVAQFLKIGVGARGVAVGESFNALTSDVTAIYWNPAGLASLARNELAFSNNNWFAGITHQFFAVGIPLSGARGTVGLFAINLSVPEEEVRTVYQPEGTGEFFSAGNLAIGASYALSLTDRFSFGFVGKYVQESVWSMHSSAVALDIGTLYRSSFRNIRIGIVLSNFGTKMQLEGRANLLFVDPDPFIEGNTETIRAELEMGKWDLPLYVRTGVAFDLVQSKAFTVSYAVDMLHPNDNREFVNTGIEVAVSDMIFLRGGYRGLGMDELEGGFAFGAGLSISVGPSSFSVDYAVTDFGRLSDVHHLTLGLGF
ncbi:MAG: PorV/PorQ family protein [Candidatus Marinimicrobia bacterium]|nr:PorV/PorQ family protein [Candidatus Neomarinimicrobiota bacterium]MDP6593415.1 PorV/PorQ family protein [Candidatus Neomarinimicrobiota bacterium]